jgi:hypothetical protein
LRAVEISARHAEGMMPPAQRIRYFRAALAFIGLCAAYLKQREVLTAAVQQDLISHPRDRAQPEYAGEKFLGPREVGHLDSEMIEPFEFDSPHAFNLTPSRLD